MWGIVSSFRLDEAQNHGASIRKPLAIEYKNKNASRACAREAFGY
jgi:hypothetical protein